MMFYARDQGVKDLSEIKGLDLSGKGILVMKDISVFDKMTSLKTLHLNDHPEFF